MASRAPYDNSTAPCCPARPHCSRTSNSPGALGITRFRSSPLAGNVTITPARVPELLLGLATVRPVFLWGAPGIGKSSLVRNFAASLGLERVSLLGTQLAPEDLIGVPQIRDGRSVFCPPEAIARDEPYCSSSTS